MWLGFDFEELQVVTGKEGVEGEGFKEAFAVNSEVRSTLLLLTLQQDGQSNKQKDRQIDR